MLQKLFIPIPSFQKYPTGKDGDLSRYGQRISPCTIAAKKLMIGENPEWGGGGMEPLLGIDPPLGGGGMEPPLDGIEPLGGGGMEPLSEE